MAKTLGFTMPKFITMLCITVFAAFFPADGQAEPLIGPEIGEPSPTGIGLATYCEGKPETATWRIWDSNHTEGSNSCYLPWEGPIHPSPGAPYPATPYHVALNLTGIWCGDEPSAVQRLVLEKPKFLYIKVPVEPRRVPARSILVSVRDFIPGYREPAGLHEGGEKPDSKWSEWRKISEKKLGSGQEIIKIPFDDLGVKDSERFQLIVYLLDGNTVYAERTVDFVSPSNC